MMTKAAAEEEEEEELEDEEMLVRRECDGGRRNGDLQQFPRQVQVRGSNRPPTPRAAE
jgi:hypothetical protein